MESQTPNSHYFWDGLVRPFCRGFGVVKELDASVFASRSQDWDCWVKLQSNNWLEGEKRESLLSSPVYDISSHPTTVAAWPLQLHFIMYYLSWNVIFSEAYFYSVRSKRLGGALDTPLYNTLHHLTPTSLYYWSLLAWLTAEWSYRVLITGWISCWWPKAVFDIIRSTSNTCSHAQIIQGLIHIEPLCIECSLWLLGLLHALL